MNRRRQTDLTNSTEHSDQAGQRAQLAAAGKENWDTETKAFRDRNTETGRWRRRRSHADREEADSSKQRQRRCEWIGAEPSAESWTQATHVERPSSVVIRRIESSLHWLWFQVLICTSETYAINQVKINPIWRQFWKSTYGALYVTGSTKIVSCCVDNTAFDCPGMETFKMCLLNCANPDIISLL